MVTEAPTAAAAELEATLEALAEVCEDLAPVVYARFFEAHPEARGLFRLDARTRGRMLNEILDVLLELAQARGYAPAAIEGLAKDHASYGEIPLTLYRGLLDALLAAMADLLGAGWTPGREAAWRAQTERLMTVVAGGLAMPGAPARAGG